MTENIKKQLEYIEKRKHRAFRRELAKEELDKILPAIYNKNLSYMKRAVLRLKLFLEYETPVILPNTKIHGLRTIVEFPDIYAPGEMDEIKKTGYVHEKGKVTNLAWNVDTVLSEGLEGRRIRLMNGKKQDAEFVECANETIDFTEQFADRYAEALRKHGDSEHAEMISRTVRYGAKTCAEALQLFRILHFTLWCSWCYHNTVGRFDQWLYPFYKADKERGVSDEEILEIIEDFFLSFNRDSDLYYSLAWGDNGQSLVLGGCLENGETAVNELTYLSLEAARELRQIDPKINLRVDKNTPDELYEKGTELTKIGLGFPQYSNDDVVIPCLVNWGYSAKDARNYAIAACWEFIIPNVAMDIPNIGGMPIAELVRNAIVNHLLECESTNELLEFVKDELRNKAKEMTEAVKNLYMEPSPIISLLMKNCLENGRDISEGATYNNYGFHGTGLSCGADQIAAVDSLVFVKKVVTKERLLNGMKTNFKNDSDLRYMLRNYADKMGRDSNANEIGNILLGLFADSLEGIKNERGGIFRAGTGSAMYYVWHGENLGATADGRDAGDYLPANFSESMFLTKSGPFSVLKGFSPENLKRTSNGGPLTLELHDTVFESEESIKKVASLVKSYILMGGHQLQLNAVNREKLMDARLHPERHQNLIVRVWGWSGRFVELNECYQNQIIKRVEFKI
ncbi:MAG: pyruvate formate-lyase [Clostridia bacterium]|nr:pyruvate formate-lyase [Clostridia bacterium]